MQTVTIYAFSIENFKRSKHEVDALMDMAKIKLTQLSQQGELLDRYGASIRILGQRSLMKPDVLEAMDRACRMTEHNDKTVLNVCFPYTSRDEITTAVRETVQEYARPVPQSQPGHERRTPFTEERIKNTLRSQHKNEQDPNEHMKDIEPTALHSPAASTTSLTSEPSAPSDTPPDQHDDLDQEAEAEAEAEADASSVSSSSTTLPPEALSSSSSPPTSYTGSPTPKPLPSRTKPPPPQPQYKNFEHITSTTINSHLFTASDPPLDLLIRTSGVERLSDFMLWQCHEDTRIVFLSVLWPEFDLWQFLPVLWEWQWRGRKEEQMGRSSIGQEVKID